MPNYYKIQMHNKEQTNNLFPRLRVDNIVKMENGAPVAVTIPVVGANGIDPQYIPDGMVGEVQMMLAVSDTAPSICATGDKYLNKTDRKVYTATGTNTWGGTGTAASQGVIYVDTTNKGIWLVGASTIVNLSPQITISNSTDSSSQSTTAVMSEYAVRYAIEHTDFPQNWKPEEHKAAVGASSVGVIKVDGSILTLDSNNKLKATYFDVSSNQFDFSTGPNPYKLVTGDVLKLYLIGGHSTYGTSETAYDFPGALTGKQTKLHDGTGITGLDTGTGNTIAFKSGTKTVGNTTVNWSYGIHYSVLS